MSTQSPENVVTQLQWRYATKKFDPTRIVPPDHWSCLEQALVLTPSSYGLQPWKFFVVTESRHKGEVAGTIRGVKRQPQGLFAHGRARLRANVGEADIDRYLTRISEVRGQSLDRSRASSA